MSTSEGVADVILDGKVWCAKSKFIANFTSEAEWIRERIDHCCRQFVRDQTIPKFRVFVDNGNRTDLAVRLTDSAIRPEETMHRWVSRSIGTDRYCLAFNGITAWDEPLARYVSTHIVLPVVKALGAPTRGFEVYLFAGRYDVTPFGIHRDREPSILIHLGPSQKVALVWAADVYRRLDGVREEINEFDVARVEPLAERRVLNNGDLIYIPAGDPHVMKSDDFSITLGVIPNLLDEKGLFAELSRELADLNGRSYPDASFVRGGEEVLSRIAGFCGSTLEWRPKLELALKSILLRLESNGYLVPSPISHPRTSVPRTNMLRVPPEYPIHFIEFDDKLRLYARGRIVQAPRDPFLVHWISRLCPGDTFNAGEVFDALSDAWDSSAVEKLISELVGWRALECDAGAAPSAT